VRSTEMKPVVSVTERIFHFRQRH